MKSFYTSFFTLVVLCTSSLPLLADDLEMLTSDQIQALVVDQKDKVVLLNFWATWCAPCIREFPDIIKLYDQYHEKGLEVIAISMNEVEEMEEIQEFLDEHKPPFPVYLADGIYDRDFYKNVSDQWRGEMPFTMIFNSSSEAVFFHKKEMSFDEFVADVSPLLN